MSVATYFANGAAFVRFGILHLMFAASVLGLLFLRAPIWLTGALGAVILALPHLLTWPLLESPIWLWLCATKTMPAMVDYIPLIPWFGAFLLGMALAQWLERLGQWPRIASLLNPDAPLVRALSWPGQHSLAIYLIHQPVLFGAVYLARMVAGS